jgi:hypothetical protein
MRVPCYDRSIIPIHCQDRKNIRTSTGTNCATFRLCYAAQIASYFDDVTFHRYENTLVVTEAAPLVASVRSTGIGAYFDEERFTRFVEEELAERGPISIRSDTGMFEATKGTLSGT